MILMGAVFRVDVQAEILWCEGENFEINSTSTLKKN